VLTTVVSSDDRRNMPVSSEGINGTDQQAVILAGVAATIVVQ